jgi:hypothetical protein
VNMRTTALRMLRRSNWSLPLVSEPKGLLPTGSSVGGDEQVTELTDRKRLTGRDRFHLAEKGAIPGALYRTWCRRIAWTGILSCPLLSMVNRYGCGLRSGAVSPEQTATRAPSGATDRNAAVASIPQGITPEIQDSAPSCVYQNGAESGDPPEPGFEST